MKKYLLTDEIIFDSKPDAVPFNYRISYKVSQICLIITLACRTNAGCSLIKLHILACALASKNSSIILERYVMDKSSYMIVRFDPAVNRALKYAIGDELVNQLGNGMFKLTPKGQELTRSIMNNDDLMLKEKEYLNLIGKKLTNDKIKNLMDLWRYEDVKN